MPVPHAVARVNARITDRFVRPLVRRSARYAVVHHVGRRTGRAYATPIVAFERDDDALVVVLTYGLRADWIRNALEGEASIERNGAITALASVEIVGRSTAWPALPRLVRLGVRALRVHDLALLTPATS